LSGAAQLLGRCQSCGARTNDGHLFPSANLRRSGTDPAFDKPVLNDIFFDLLDRNRRLVNPQHTRRFARRGTNPPGEFRKIVSRVQLANRLFPTPVIDQIVPIRNQVVDGTSRLTEGHAAVHAARALSSQLFFGKVLIDLEPVVDALRNWTPRGNLARVFQESRALTHVAPPGAWTVRPSGDSGYKAGVCGSLRAHVCVRGGRL